MRYFNTLMIMVAALGLFFASTAGAQGFMTGDDPLMVQPDVFVVIDTSGSMNWGSYPCGVGGALNCRRFTATRQVLTGTYKGAVGDCSNQLDDGILDMYKDLIRFGFSTFDNDLCATHGALTAWDYGDDTHTNQRLGIKGRGAYAGHMIDLVDPVNPDDLLANNQNVQQAACQNTANGCTPLSASLYDTLYYYQNWESEIGYNDSLATCRPRFVLLMTDGGQYPGDGWYSSAPFWAAQNLAAGIPVFVVAFGGGAAGANAIALAGSGGLLGAFTATNPATLFASFSAILNAILAGTSSRTQLVSSPAENSFTESHQYAAFFDITMSGVGWTGHLVQLPIVDMDVAGNPVYGPVGDWVYFEDHVAAMPAANRKIYTVINDPRSQTFDWNKDSAAFDNSHLPRYLDDGNPNIGMVSFASGMHDAQIEPLMCLANPADLDPVRDWMRGVPGTVSSSGSVVLTGPFLGDIFHSTPAVVKRPAALSPDYRYELYFQKNARRDTMVYVGANDGMLHAFVGEDLDSDGDLGEEIWSFVPNNLLAKVQRTRMAHEEYVDGSPVVRDVYFNNIMAKYPDDSPYALGAYRTVLFSGERGGGDTYFALDVTDPDNPGYLWEYRTGQSSSVDYTSAQCQQGHLESWAKPVVGQVWLKNEHPTGPENEYESRSVMIVPGGYVSPYALMNVSSCVEVTEMMMGANSLHVIDVETGKLLKKFMFSQAVDQTAQNLLDDYYADRAACEGGDASKCNGWNHFGAGSGFTGAGWNCGEKRDDIRDAPYVPDALWDHCTVTEDANVYKKECCMAGGTGGCSAGGLTSCYYLYEKKKNVPGGLHIYVKTEGCSLVPVGQRGRMELNVDDDVWMESVAARPVAYSSTLGEFITRVFVPTTTGKIWRVDMGNGMYNYMGVENPVNYSQMLVKKYSAGGKDFCWDVTRQDEDQCNPAKQPVAWFDMLRDDTVNNPTEARPIMVDPTLALDYNRELLVYFGTGNTENLEYTTTQNYFYGVREAHKTGGSFDLEPLGQLEDQIAFGETSERLFGKPLVAAGNVFFTTYVPIDNDCLPGFAKAYGVKFTNFTSPDNPLPGAQVLAGAGTPSSPKMTITEKGPVVLVQQGASVEPIPLGNSVRPAAKPMQWGKVL